MHKLFKILHLKMHYQNNILLHKIGKIPISNNIIVLVTVKRWFYDTEQWTVKNNKWTRPLQFNTQEACAFSACIMVDRQLKLLCSVFEFIRS